MMLLVCIMAMLVGTMVSVLDCVSLFKMRDFRVFAGRVMQWFLLILRRICVHRAPFLGERRLRAYIVAICGWAILVNLCTCWTTGWTKILNDMKESIGPFGSAMTGILLLLS